MHPELAQAVAETVDERVVDTSLVDDADAIDRLRLGLRRSDKGEAGDDEREQEEPGQAKLDASLRAPRRALSDVVPIAAVFAVSRH